MQYGEQKVLTIWEVIQMSKENVLVIDTNAILYKAINRSFKENEDLSSNVPFLLAVEDIITEILYVFKRLDFKYIISSMDSMTKLQRCDISPEYKANRSQKRTPDRIFLKKNMVLTCAFINDLGIKNICYHGYESDDVLYNIANTLKNDYNIYVYTMDKDILQIVDTNINYITQRNNEYFIIDKDNKLFLNEKFGINDYKNIVDYLIMVGDSSDNVKGIEKIGSKSASILINTFGDIDNIFDNADEIKNIQELRSRKIISENMKKSKDIIELNKQLVSLMDIPNFKIDIKDFTLSDTKYRDINDRVLKSNVLEEKYNYFYKVL